MRTPGEHLDILNQFHANFFHVVLLYFSVDTSAVPSGAATPTNDKTASNGVVNNVPSAPKPKPLGEPLGLEPLDEVDDIKILDCGVPAPDVPGNWSWEVALRCDKYILEQVEALEDKVAAASMQVPVRVEQQNCIHFSFAITIINSMTIEIASYYSKRKIGHEKSCWP